MGMFDKMKEAKDMYSNIKKAQNEISKILNTIPNKINDPIVSSLNAFSGAFVSS